MKLKHSRTIKLYKDGYLTDEEFQGEIAAIELAIRELESPDMNGIKLDEVLAAGERLPGIAALWDVATVEERREMVMLLLEPGGLLYDLELKMIAAITPRLVFLPILRLLEDVEEHKESPGTLVTSGWFQERRRNRRVSSSLSPIFYLFLIPSGILYQKVQLLRGFG